jgi:hypothetical protein
MEYTRFAPLWGIVSALLLSIGCGDLTDSVGEQGRLRFTLATNYVVDEDELTDALLVAGHVQELDVELTNKGDDDINEPDEVTYRIHPTPGTDLDLVAGGDDDPPDLRVMVKQPGSYRLDALYQGNIVDTIELDFDTPDSLELSVKIRKPFDDDFDAVSSGASPVPVVEGAQATFLPIPKKGKRRLAGTITTEVSATPKELVVPGEGASLVYEQDVWSVEGNVDFYFIDPGKVTITITDPISKASGSYTFMVSDAE